VTLGTANPTITVSAKTLTIGGVIGEGAAGRGITKAGAGTLVLNGTGNYTGATTINVGKLVVGGTLGSGDVTVAAGANLTINGSNVIADTATLNVAGTGVVVLNNTEKEVVKKLILDGVEQPPVATYGAIGSGAVNESAAFSGKGLLAFPPQGTLLVVK
jgi:autotransporter-associated beta strand protein